MVGHQAPSMNSAAMLLCLELQVVQIKQVIFFCIETSAAIITALYQMQRHTRHGLENGVVRPGDAVVLRMLGPKGGPGTVFAASFMAALVGAGLGERA